MKSLIIALLSLTSCYHLAHVEPLARLPATAAYATVLITAACNDLASATDPHVDLGDIPLKRPTHATGTVISERHVLTAYHAVHCPGEITHVVVTLSDGRRRDAVVIREDEDQDLALLEMDSGGYFNLYISPPELAWINPGVHACAALLRGQSCGYALGLTLFDLHAQPGDSGAAVYDDAGRLLGLVSGGTKTWTTIAPLDPSWLAGT